MMSRRRFGFSALAFVAAAAVLLASCSGGHPTRLRTEFLSVPGYQLVTLRILITAGSADDPPGKEGLCRLTWSMLAGGGSRSTDRGTLEARLFPLGGEIDLSVDKEVTALSGTVRADAFEAFYRLLRECLFDPGFREEDFLRLKAGQLAALEGNLTDARDDDRLADEALNMMMYAGHPYGHSEYGTVASVKALSLDDIKAFFFRTFVRGNVVLGLGGGFTEKLLREVLADFERLPRSSAFPSALPPVRRPAGIEVGIVDKAAPGDSVRLGFPLPVRRGDRDYFALWIAAECLAEDGIPFGRMIREDGMFAPGNSIMDVAIEHAAWTAGRFPRPNHLRRQQHFSVRLAVPESGGGIPAARRVLAALRRMAADGIPEDRFERTRLRLLSEVRLYARTLDEHVAWRIDSRFAGVLDLLSEVQYALPRVGRDDVNRAIRTHLDSPGVFVAVVTGNAKAAAEGMNPDSVRMAGAIDVLRGEGWPIR